MAADRLRPLLYFDDLDLSAGRFRGQLARAHSLRDELEEWAKVLDEAETIAGDAGDVAHMCAIATTDRAAQEAWTRRGVDDGAIADPQEKLRAS